ncbi:hypothetical protein HK405_013028 [Cladochytrium tenue]|nr:hypothetical protein HK405_013028 [Cladochytrium tenue]
MRRSSKTSAPLASAAPPERKACPPLPIIVLDDVFTHLRRQRMAAVARVALVCRAWAAAARKALYAALIVTEGEFGSEVDKRLHLHESGAAAVGRDWVYRTCWTVPRLDGSRGAKVKLLVYLRWLQLDLWQSDEAKALEVLEIFARAGTRPTYLRVTLPCLTRELVAAMTPMLGRVTRLEFYAREGYDMETLEEFANLFAGRLEECDVNLSLIRTFHMSNLLTIKRMFIHSMYEKEDESAVLDFFATKPPLAEVSLFECRDTEPILEALQAGCSRSLTRLELDIYWSKASGFLPIVSELPNLKNLSVVNWPYDGESDQITAPTVWPSLRGDHGALVSSVDFGTNFRPEHAGEGSLLEQITAVLAPHCLASGSLRAGLPFCDIRDTGFGADHAILDPMARSPEAYLVVLITPPRGGGMLRLSDQLGELVVDWSQVSRETASSSKATAGTSILQWAAFKPDCQATVSPITAGRMITLVYPLFAPPVRSATLANLSIQPHDFVGVTVQPDEDMGAAVRDEGKSEIEG